MKRSLYVFLACVLVLTCKEYTEIKQDQSEVNLKEAKHSKRLVFEVNLETNKPDEFRVFSNDIFLNNSQFMNITVKQKLNNAERSKNMIVEFPEGIVPDFNLGLSLGDKYEKVVKINRITIKFDALQYDMDSDNIMDYFVLNPYVEFDSISKSFITKTVNNKHQPKLFLRKRIIDQISNN